MITSRRVYAFFCLAWVMYFAVAELGRTGSYWMALLNGIETAVFLFLGMLFGRWLAEKMEKDKK